MKRAILALAVLALFAAGAWASVPDPAMCYVSPWDAFTVRLLGRGVPKTGGSVHGAITVTVKANIGGVPTPIDGAYVEVSFREDCVTNLCTDAQVTGYTNASGVAALNVGAGGCCQGGASVVVKAGDDTVIPPALTVIRAYEYFASPDFNGAIALGNLGVTLGDFTAFGINFGGTSYCSDYNGDGVVSLSDFTVFGQTFGNGCVAAL
jgi:hypothetical protein